VPGDQHHGALEGVLLEEPLLQNIDIRQVPAGDPDVLGLDALIQRWTHILPSVDDTVRTTIAAGGRLGP